MHAMYDVRGKKQQKEGRNNRKKEGQASKTQAKGLFLFGQERAEKPVCGGCVVMMKRCLRAGGVLGDSLGSLRHSVLGEFTGKGEAHSSLDLTGRKGGLLGVAGELSGFSG